MLKDGFSGLKQNISTIKKDVGLLKKDVKVIKQDMAKTRKDINTIIGYFDNEYIDLRTRVDAIEKHL